MSERKKLEEGSFGPVTVWAGEHKGKTGYYDDDQGASAIVYFEEPFKAPFAVIQRRWLAPTDKHLPTITFMDQNAREASRAGVIGTRV